MARNITNTNRRQPQIEVINNLTTNEAAKALSAAQGKALKDSIDAINNLLQSNDVNLDTIQEIVDRIKANKSLLDGLTADNLVGLADKLAAKQDKATLGTDVANAGFIKQTAVDTAIDGLKTNGKIKDDLLPTNIVRYDAEGDITTAHKDLASYADAEVPTSKSVQAAIAAAQAAATETKATLEAKLQSAVRFYNIVINGSTEGQVSDTFITEDVFAVHNYDASDAERHVDIFVENGKIIAASNKTETNFTVKVVVVKNLA